MIGRIEVVPVRGLPEVGPGDDLGALLVQAFRRARVTLRPGDIVVVKQKVVSKAEGRVLALKDVVPGAKAKSLARSMKKDPRLVEAVLRESTRVVRAGHGVIITRTRQGFVCANSGIDRSNVGRGRVALLPEDSDASARRMRLALEAASGVKLAVVVTDTFGRPWRTGQTDVAIGCSGISPLQRYKGRKDAFGYALRVTEPAVVDEVAGAAELATGKLSRIPAAVVRGVKYRAGDQGVRSIIMPEGRDLFR